VRVGERKLHSGGRSSRGGEGDGLVGANARFG
jgi:hypothetical protein